MFAASSYSWIYSYLAFNGLKRAIKDKQLSCGWIRCMWLIQEVSKSGMRVISPSIL